MSHSGPRPHRWWEEEARVSRKGGGVGIPRAHDRYIVNTFTLYYHGNKEPVLQKKAILAFDVVPIFTDYNFTVH